MTDPSDIKKDIKNSLSNLKLPEDPEKLEKVIRVLTLLLETRSMTEERHDRLTSFFSEFKKLSKDDFAGEKDVWMDSMINLLEDTADESKKDES